MNIQPSLFDDFEIDNNSEEQVEQPKQLTGEEARIVELRETLNRHNHSTTTATMSLINPLSAIRSLTT